MENQLLQLYLPVCQIDDQQTVLKSPRLSNFKPRFADRQLVTVLFIRSSEPTVLEKGD